MKEMLEKPIRLISRRKVLSSASAILGGAAVSALGINSALAAPNGKRITVITGSPHRHGSSFLLADRFIEGAQSVGASVFRFDAAFKRVTACSACDRCGMGGSDCVYRDDMFELNPHLMQADLVVFCTPLYYYGFSAQIKLVIDRFYAINSQLHVSKEAVLLAVAWNSSPDTFPALAHHYERLCDYMGWKNVGEVLGVGCGTRSMTESTRFPDEAYELGKLVGKVA